MIVSVEANRQGGGVVQEHARYARRISPEVVRNKRNRGVEVVLLGEAEERFEIKKSVVFPEKRIIDNHRSEAFAWPPALVTRHISQRHDMGHKPGKVLGQGCSV